MSGSEFARAVAVAASLLVSSMLAQDVFAQDAPVRLFGWNDVASSWQCNLAIACDDGQCGGGLMCIDGPILADYCSVTELGLTDAQCCSPDADEECKRDDSGDALEGVCAEIDDPSDPKKPVKFHVCAYPDVFDFCASRPGAPTFENVHDCFTTPGEGKGPEEPTDDWRLGDCDNDGIENKADCCPCTDACDLLPPDCEEEGMEDGGVPDAGEDEDGGDVLPDADTQDGAVSPPPRPDYSFRGDGGCKCDLAGPRSDGGQRGLALGLLFLCVLIARRAFSRSATD